MNKFKACWRNLGQLLGLRVASSVGLLGASAMLAGCQLLPPELGIQSQVEVEVVNAASVPICQISTSKDGATWEDTTRFESEIVQPGARRKIYFPRPSDPQDKTTSVSYKVRFHACNEVPRAGDKGPTLAEKTVQPLEDRSVSVP